MKKTLLKLIFMLLAFTFFLGMLGIAELLAKMVTMNFVMTVVYVALGFSFIYILKN